MCFAFPARAGCRCGTPYAGFRPGMVVVDIGCGPGYPVKWLPGADYHGFDISSTYIAYARSRYGDRGEFHCDPFGPKHLRQVPPADIARLLLDNDRGKHVWVEKENLRLANREFSGVEPEIREDLFYIPYTQVVLKCRP